MEPKSYPLFEPPEAIAAKSHRDWSKKEAQRYFAWLIGCLEQRVAGLLDFLGIERAERMDARELLAEVGDRAALALENPACSETGRDGEPVLTNMGYSLAADIGLLTAKLIQSVVGDRVKWEIVRKPKSDVSYNLPVLTGIGWDTYDPVGVSIADAVAVLAGRRSSDAWVKVFDSCVADARR
ncbi:hypothetical protein [Haliangium sp.]|uniref:hypothetical protein n=1 Tax=Haliangium sp. TaxID=2663208 RepID=UPI003D0DBC32